MTYASSLDAMIDPLSRLIDRESSLRLAEFRVPQDVRSRVAELAALANEGELTEVNRAEYESLIDAADFVAILKLEAKGNLDADSEKRRKLAS
ncbi:MAG: hypothetical protein SFV18_01685 [Bryobacteraceae bacterium]|nr:hypothetical protein [Bryobacteraceae bacterium]